MPFTVSDAVNAVINELSQVPGQATQIYATPRIQQHVQDAVQLEIEELWWPQLMMHQKVAVDLISGLPTEDIKGPIGYIDEWHDIAAVFPAGSSRAFPQLPLNVNPYTIAGRSRYVSPANGSLHRPFTIWPPGTADVVVLARQRPVMPMALPDPVYIDGLLITYDACWMYAVDDGTIPAQVNKFQVLAANRRKRIKAAHAQHSSLLDSRYPETVDQDYFVVDEDPLA